MIYFKPLIRKITNEPEIIKQVEELNSDKDIIDFLLLKNFDKMDLVNRFEKHYGLKYIELKNIFIEPSLLAEFDTNFLKSQYVIPYKIDEEKKMYYFAINDITNQQVKKTIEKSCRNNGYRSKFSFALAEDIIQKYDNLDTVEEILETTSIDDFNAQEWVDQIISHAISVGASDIHIEPLEVGLQVRQRIDGVLTNKKYFNFSKSRISNICVRIKVISGMNIAEKRRAQDGRIDKFKYKDSLYDLRISAVSTIFGEKIVMRIFDTSGAIKTFDELGFTEEDTVKTKRMLNKKNGIIYMAGATGSGKTTSLYTMIDYINKDDVNIYTIEDPVEKTIENVNQIQIDESAGILYASTLRALLRQDPDIIVVGEIRDAETAELSLRASLTGHLVLSTIHANNALDSINRMLDMDIEPYLLSASAVGFLSQRLVRVLCPHCKEKVEKLSASEKIWLDKVIKENNLEEVSEDSFYKAVGCEQCTNGYKGRLAILEIVEISEELRHLIARRASSEEIKKQALKDGFKPFEVNGIQKALEGKTTIEELIKQLS